MIKKILIANRGEIALRVIRACKELGLKSVAVYSEADASSLHVKFADEAVCIGPPPSRLSYLNIPALITAAMITNSDAIHPGYGFLAENETFVDICNDCNIIFIGPRAESIRLMGHKAMAKDTMKRAGVPVIPGSEGIVHTLGDALRTAGAIGYPVLLKAVAGGGGKGMRIVSSDDELKKAFPMTRNEAEKAFNNPDLYIEKLITKSRHIEIQILGDKFGNVIHLNERECSIQRRHQKLIEESPSPFVTPELRQAMGAAAIKGASAVNYIGPGTIEYLVDDDRQFYFMEMNTRIQVEHTVTEESLNVDLVKEQILIASGEAISCHGGPPLMHSIECRINAENPYKDFMPMPGRIESLHVPGGHGVRVDTHVYAGYMIPPYYDSLIAKLITFASSRGEAILKMRRALEEFVIEGVPTTIPFHKLMMENENFAAGRFHTDFLDGFKMPGLS